MARHYVVTIDDALRAHELALQSGGRAGIKSENDILSALGRPYTGYYRSIDRKAAALLQSVATNHGFIDGNKRTALLLTTLLIGRSGYRLVAKGNEDLQQAFEDLVVSVLENHLSVDVIAGWFASRLRRPATRNQP